MRAGPGWRGRGQMAEDGGPGRGDALAFDAVVVDRQAAQEQGRGGRRDGEHAVRGA